MDLLYGFTTGKELTREDYERLMNKKLEPTILDLIPKTLELIKKTELNFIKWNDFEVYGLDYSTAIGTFGNWKFDIRCDCDTINNKIKPDKCNFCLTIYFKDARITDTFGSVETLKKYSEKYLIENN